MPDFKNGISVNGLPLADGGGNVLFGRLPVAVDGISDAAALVRADDSRLFDGRAPIGAAAGDLGGTYPDPTVVGLWGRAIAPSDPLHGQVYWFNGVSDVWEPASLTPSPFATTIGDGSTTEFVITHNLGTRDVVVNVWETDEPYSAVTVETELTSDDEITLLFGIPPEQDAYRVVIAQGGGGAVSRVELTAPPQFVVLGNPITTSGVLDLTWATQTANRVLAGPSSGAAAAPTFRALVSGDLPSHQHSAADITTGTLGDGRLSSNVLLKSGNLAGLADLSATRSNLGLGTAAVRDRGAANGVASLDSGGKVPSTQLPSIAISDTFVVEDEEAMLALDAEAGDVAVRTDLSKSFILADTPASTLESWQELLTPTDVVTSVAGRVGDVQLMWSDINSPPTTIGDYGITDAYTKAQADARYAPIAVPFSSITGVPSTLAYTNVNNLFSTAQGIRVAASGLAHGLYVGPLDGSTLPLIAAGSYASTMAGQVAIYGKALNRAGVQGDSYGDVGVYGKNTSNAGWGLWGEVVYSATNAIRSVMMLRHTSSATTVAGFGTQLDLAASRGASPFWDIQASLWSAWTDITGIKAYLALGVANGSLPAEVMRLTSDLRLGLRTTAPNFTLEAAMVDIYPAINIAEASTSNRRATIGFGLNAAANSGWIMGQGYNNDTTKDFYLIDLTANAVRWYINTSGNIGIGTVSPGAKLDVIDGYIRARSGANNPPASGVGLELVYTGGYGYIVSYDRDASAYKPIRIQGSTVMLTTTLGIGTESPGARLYVQSSHNNATADIGQFLASNLTQGIGIGFNNISMIGTGTNLDLYLISKGSGAIYFQAPSGSNGTIGGNFRIDWNGNVVARGGIYPGDQGSYYLTYDSNPAGLATNGVMSALQFYPGWPSNTGYFLYYATGPNGIGINGNLTLTGGVYPSNQVSYYLYYGAAAGQPVIATNASLFAGGAYLFLGNQGSYYFYYDSGNVGYRSNGALLANGNIYWGYGGNWLSAYLDQALLSTSSPTFAGLNVLGSSSGEFSVIFRNTHATSKKTSLAIGGKIAFGVDIGASGANDVFLWSIPANAAWLTISGSGYVGLGGVSSASYRLELPNVGNASGQGRANAWVTYSSRRWKEHIRPIDDALSVVNQLRGVRFDWKAEYGGTADIGCIAEEVGVVIPELVTWENETDAGDLKYDRLTAVLIEAVKALSARVEELEKGVPRTTAKPRRSKS